MVSAWLPTWIRKPNPQVLLAMLLGLIFAVAVLMQNGTLQEIGAARGIP
jgi:hypothetical protein